MTSGGGPSGKGAGATVTPPRAKQKCPECGRSSDPATFPFCSIRCKAVDLNRWLSGSYVIPGPELPEKADDED